ncbi:MAG: DUF2085 domain-containing protein [Ignavibacteriaceae bacterium]|nr:DUF2085 domain-containing protein [Ignavibacteriaceae bacterium]
MLSPVMLQRINSYEIVKPFINQMYSTVCHQQQAKTIALFNEEILVCSRCAGIYFGVLFGIISSFFIRIKNNLLKFVWISSIVVLSDVVAVNFGFYDYSKIIAIASGLFFGLTIILFLENEFKFFNLLNKNEK